MRANEFIVEYKLSVSKDADGVAVKATAGGKPLGHAEFFFDDEGRLDPQTVWVDERYHGQGIARDMYDHLKDLGYTIVRSWDQTDAGRGFWNKHRGEDARVWEDASNNMSVVDMIAYLKTHHDPNLHQDYTDYIENTFDHFVLKNIPTNSIPSELPKLDREKVERYRQMDFSKAPPIVIGDKYILDGYHRLNAAKVLGIPSIQAYVGVKKQLKEISRDRLERYLDRAGRQVDTRQERMALARQRLSTSYEIYHADEPAKIVDRFDADTPADAQRYYQDYIERYESDRDYDLRLRKSTGIMEVTMVNTQSKSKRQHLDVMPNDGEPIPPGEEADYLGKLVAELGNGYQLWAWSNRGTVTYYVFDTDTRTSQLATTGRPYPSNPNSFVIQGVYSGPENQYRAADLYAFLILDLGLTLVSDNKQSEGGYRVWQELERRYGRKLNVHGFDTRTNEPVNVTTQDEPDTHVSRADVKRAGPQMKKELGSISRDLRFVASAR
jgi:GNAT superfamily N-acetyltransferase